MGSEVTGRCAGAHCTGHCLCNIHCDYHNGGCYSNYTSIAPVNVTDIITPAKLHTLRNEINAQRARWNAHSAASIPQYTWNNITSPEAVAAYDRNRERAALANLGFVHGPTIYTNSPITPVSVNNIIDSLNDARRSCVCNTNCDGHSVCACHNDCGCNYAWWLS